MTTANRTLARSCVDVRVRVLRLQAIMSGGLHYRKSEHTDLSVLLENIRSDLGRLWEEISANSRHGKYFKPVARVELWSLLVGLGASCRTLAEQ